MTKTEVATTDKLEMIEQVAAENSLERLEPLGHVTAAVKMAGAMNQLRKLIKGPVLDEVRQLAGSPLGFLTDREYRPEELLDPAIECLLRGGRWTGNEFNVIAGRCYMTLQFYERRVGDLVEQLRIREHVPQVHDGGALVGMEATWVFDGHEMSQRWVKTPEGDHRIPVKVNKQMGADAILGKARRKLLARIYREITGSAWSAADAAAETIEPEQGEIEVDPETIEPEQGEIEVDPETGEQLPDDLPQEEQPDSESRLQQQLGGMTTMMQVNEFRRQWTDHAKRGGKLELLDRCCDARIEEIRATRGQRSNKKD